MSIKKLIFFLLIVAGVSQAQVRWDLGGPISGVSTISTGPIPFLIALTDGVQLNWCNYPANSVQGSACTNFAQTFTDSTLTTACPSTQPIVLQDSNVCRSTSDPLGNLGIWTVAGTYTYTLTDGSTTYGPFVVTLGGSGGGSGQVRINGSLQATVNLNGTAPTADAGFGLATIKSDGSNVSVEFPISPLPTSEFCLIGGPGVPSTLNFGFQTTANVCTDPFMQIIQQHNGGAGFNGPITFSGTIFASNQIDLGPVSPLVDDVASCSGGSLPSTLVKYSVSGGAVCAAQATTGDSTNIEGITTSNVGAGGGFPGHTAIARTGYTPCIFDGATTANDHVIESTTNAGQCHDTGSTSVPPGDVGVVMSTNTGAGTYSVRVAGRGGSSASGITGVVANQGIGVLGNSVELIQTCANTQVLSWNTAAWVCTNPTVGSGNTTSTAGTTGFLSVFNGTNSIINSHSDEGITNPNAFTISDTAGLVIVGTQGLATGPFTTLPATPGTSKSGIVFGPSGVVYMSFNNDSWTAALRSGGVAASDVTTGTFATALIPDIGGTYQYVYASGTNFPGITGDCSTPAGSFVVTCLFENPMITVNDTIVGGASGVAARHAAPTTPNGVAQIQTSTPSGGVSGAWTNSLPGLAGRAVLGTTNTDIILTSDCSPKRVEYLTSVNVAVTLPTATTLAVPQCTFRITDSTSAGNTVTIIPTTWTVNGAATLILQQGQVATFTVDPNSATNWTADVVESGILAGAGITLGRSQFGGLTVSASGGGGAPALSAVTGSAALATATEIAAGFTKTEVGLETTAATAPFVWQNTNNTTSATIAAMFNTAGTGANQIAALFNNTNSTGDIFDCYSGGAVTNGLFSGGTQECSMGAGGIFKVPQALLAPSIGTAAASQSLTVGGFASTTSNIQAGGTTVTSSAVGSGSGAAQASGPVLIQPASNGGTSATSAAGGLMLSAAISTGATQGLQGLLTQDLAYIKGTTVTQWNLQCLQSAMKVQDCGASPTNILGVAEVANSNTVQMTQDGQIPINASAGVTVGDTVCAGSTAGKVTDSGGTASCTNSQGIQLGIVIATAGTWKLGDGTSFTATAILPLIQLGTGTLASPGGGSVTSITFSSPLSGGVVTSIGTAGCPTCLVASSPGVGILHVAGSTQTATSSAVNLANSDVTGVLPLANMSQLFVTNAQTTTYPVTSADFLACKTIPVSSSTFTITLVASGSQPASGQCVDIINYGTGVVTVARSGQNINGAAANLTLAAGSASAPNGLHVVSDGTNYIAQPWGAGAGVSTPPALTPLAKTSSYTILSTDMTTPSAVTFTCSAACVATLPSSAPTTGAYVTIQNATLGVPANFSLTVYPNGKNLNGSQTPLIIAPGSSVLIESDGTNYEYLGQGVKGPKYPNSRPWSYYKSACTTTVGLIGPGFFINSVNGSHNAINASSTEPCYYDLATSTSSGTSFEAFNQAGTQQWFFTNNIYKEMRVELPSTATERIWLVLSNQQVSTMNASDTPVGPFVGFRYSTVAGDTNWMACVSVNSSTAATCTSTGVAVGTTGVVLSFQMADNLVTPAVLFYVNGVLTNTITSGIPATAVAAEDISTILTETAAASHLRIANEYVESDKY